MHFNTKILFALILLTPMTTFARTSNWTSLSPYHRDLIAYFLPQSGAPWSADAVRDVLHKQGTRSAVYLAVGLLLRNENADRTNAQALIRALLALQHNDPGDKMHGNWPTSLEPERDRHDANWREFIGTGLIVARETFPDALDKTLTDSIDAALICAAEGAAARNVSAGYTNIALMSACLMDYAGHLAPATDFRERGVAKARDVFDLFSKHHTFNEYNSPTYYGTDLLALAVWRELAKSPELRQWGISMEADLWRDIGQFYHAGLKNMAGPYARAYGMDMTHYTALTGLCIAMALDDSALAPIPTESGHRAMYEWAYTPLFAILGMRVPDDVMPNLRAFTGPRTVTRLFADRDQVHQAQALLEPDWMMGAGTGLNRRWEQRCPATVHWAVQSDKSIGWLLVNGTSGVEARIENRALHITIPHPDPTVPLRVLIHAHGASPDSLQSATWRLPDMAFDVHTPFTSPTIRKTTEHFLGDVIEITWPIPPDWNPKITALTLKPVPPK